MKNVLRFLIIAAAVASPTLPAFAQDTSTSTGATAAATSAQEAQAKADLYARFLKLFKGTPEEQRQAAEVGREYLTKYGAATDEADKKIVDYIRNWVTKYEVAVADFEFDQAIENNPSRAFQLGRSRLAAGNADELKIHLRLVQAALNGARKNPNDKSFYGDALNSLRRALQLVEQGRTTDAWGPVTSQQEAVEGLNYYIGYFAYENSPTDVAKNLLKVAQSGGSFSKLPQTYQLLGGAYYAELAKLVTEYKKYENKEETPESKALFDKINAVIDRTIDAYARAIALSGTKAEYAPIVAKLRPLVTNLYKQRHENSDAGLNEYIAGVLQKPLPIPGQEPQPTPAPSSNSSGSNGTGAAAPASNTTTTTPTSTNVSQPAATPNTGAKPAATTTPATPTPKPKP